MEQFLLFLATVIFLCIVAGKISDKLQLPSLLLFLIVGMIFGVKIHFSDFHIAQQICAAALLTVIFYGGFCTKIIKEKQKINMAICLSSLGTLLTAAVTCFACYMVFRADLKICILLSAVLSSTDAASVFSILKSKKMNLKYSTGAILETESGSNDPFAYMLTVLAIYTIKNGNYFEILPLFLKQVFFGIFFGIIVAKAGIYIFKKYELKSEGAQTLFVLALAFLSYSITAILEGNEYLSTYLTGIILGNSAIKNKKNLNIFFEGANLLCQITIFFTLGLLCRIESIKAVIIPSLIITLILLFISRPAAVYLTTKPFRAPNNQIAIISLAGFRGAASVVFAIFALDSIKNSEYDLFHIVFMVSMLSIAIEGVLLPYFAKKLNMSENYHGTEKTFNDYQDESLINLSKTIITQNHSYANKKIKDIKSKNSIILLILREGCKIIPRPDTTIKPKDKLLIGTSVVKSADGIILKEMPITKNHEWKNKKISQIKFNKGFFAALVKRGENTFIPKDDTKLIYGDVLIFYQI